MPAASRVALQHVWGSALLLSRQHGGHGADKKAGKPKRTEVWKTRRGSAVLAASIQLAAAQADRHSHLKPTNKHKFTTNQQAQVQ
jgi:hypothetical protein